MILRQFFVLFLCLIAAPAWAAEAMCVRPNVDRLLEEARVEIDFQEGWHSEIAKFLPFDADGQHLRWLGVGWAAPPAGALLVVDCRGRRLAATRLGRLGYVLKLHAGPVLPGVGQLAVVEYVSGAGSGTRDETIDLVAFNGKRIFAVWSHSGASSVGIPQLGGDYSDTVSLRFAAAGTRIEVATQREIYSVKDDHGWAPHTKHTFPKETFCWSAAKTIYEACTP